MRRDPRCPDSESKWELRYHDYFDRDADSSKEAEGTGIVEGLATLWRKEALEGVADDGSSTFTTFTILWGNRAVESAKVHRDPFVRPGLKNIRLWRSEELFEEIATAHLRLLERRRNKRVLSSGDESRAILELAEKSEDVEAFRRALRKL
jgi:hypothetical protein